MHFSEKYRMFHKIGQAFWLIYRDELYHALCDMVLQDGQQIAKIDIFIEILLYYGNKQGFRYSLQGYFHTEVSITWYMVEIF